MATSFHLRQVTPADLDRCVAIEHAVFLPSEAATREQIAVRIEQFPEGFLVAEAEVGVVGLINTGITAKDDLADEALKSLIGHDLQGGNVVVLSLAVLPEWQGRGIARNLLDAVIAAAHRQHKYAVLLLCKQQLVGFYERLGFVNRGLSSSSHGGFSWHQMVYPLLPDEMP